MDSALHILSGCQCPIICNMVTERHNIACEDEKNKKKKSPRRPKAACIKGRSPNWTARDLTRRPSKPTLDTASLGESQKQI
eukprot:470266-Pelagomonas_calceolata.AAC.1